MPLERPVGIDLGTSNSAIASVDANGRSLILANAEGDYITPSIVYFGQQEVVVGKNARSAVASQPDMVAQWVKRDMGARVYSRPHPRPLPAAGSDRGLHSPQAQGRRGAGLRS